MSVLHFLVLWAQCWTQAGSSVCAALSLNKQFFLEEAREDPSADTPNHFLRDPADAKQAIQGLQDIGEQSHCISIGLPSMSSGSHIIRVSQSEHISRNRQSVLPCFMQHLSIYT